MNAAQRYESLRQRAAKHAKRQARPQGHRERVMLGKLARALYETRQQLQPERVVVLTPRRRLAGVDKVGLAV